MNLSDIWLANIEIDNLLWKREIFNMQQKNKKKGNFSIGHDWLARIKSGKIIFFDKDSIKSYLRYVILNSILKAAPKWFSLFPIL